MDKSFWKAVGVFAAGIALTALSSVFKNGKEENDILDGPEDPPDDYDFTFPIDCGRCGSMMIHELGTNHWYCTDCGNDMYVEDGHFCFEHSSDDDYDEYYDIPEGCRACGNDSYPNCIDGCALYDD